MTAEPTSLSLIKPIPAQIVNEGATFTLKLQNFIHSSTTGQTYYRAELANGEALPKGLICTSEGLLTGIAGAATQGVYTIVLSVVNDEADELQTEFNLTIQPRMTVIADYRLFNELKAAVWDALGKNLPPPEIEAIFNRPLTAVELYYLLERFGTLTIWDVFNLEQPSAKKALNLAGASEHYHIYDRGSCLIGVPKDLFSHTRTRQDALITARAMAREVYQRGWVIEFAGYDKMVRAAWVELQHLSALHGKALDILHFTPSEADIKLYESQAKAKGPSPAPG